MTEAYRDGNFVTTLLGTSSSDGVTPINVYVDPVTHRLLVDISGGAGDVVGPASSTDTAIALFDGTTGKLIQNSSATLSDAGVLTVTDIVTSEVKASGSGGLDILNSSGSQVALFGAGGSTGTSLFGTTNIGSASADYIQITGGTGATTFTATGSSTNIDITAVPKGSGAFKVNGAAQISGSFALSGGTANGVLYLNGSKVATSGSALTFDGTNFFGGTNIYTAGRFYAQRSSSSLNLPIAGYTDGSAGAVLSGATGDIVAFGNAGGDGVIFANANTEQMRLTSTGLAIGTTSTSARLNVQAGTSATGNSAYFANVDGTYNPYLMVQHSSVGIKLFNSSSYGGASNNLIFGNGSTSETMRIDVYGNLLIGTTSQVYSEKLAVQNDQNSSTYQLIRNNNSGASAASGLSLNAYGNSWGIEVGSAAKNSNALTFNVDYLGTPVEKMRLTTDGNIGLGTTPSAWHSNFRVLQTGLGYASFVGDSSNGYAEVLNNCYASGASTYNYVASLAVTRYSQQLGVHKWYVAAAGTAGNTITFTEVMTIGSNGNVGINNSSPSYKLDVSGTGHFTKTVSFDEFDNGNSGTADTIDWTQGNKQKSTLTGNCTFTFTAPGGPASLILKLVQDATGSRTVTWPAAVHWSGGTAPTLTTTANKVDIITFYYDGTTYFGNSTLNFTA